MTNYFEILKLKNPLTNYTSNMGQRWTTEEENTLLEELDKNINIEIIAQIHNRTVGGIRGRQQTIAYNMHLKNVSIEEIIIKTRLDEEQIMETIARKEKPRKVKPIKLENKITDGPFLKILKKKNTLTYYPSNMGQRWTTEEENTLLEELDKNINIEVIAQLHNRTVDDIRLRQQTIAYNMRIVSIEEIIIKTRLDKEQIMKIITRKEPFGLKPMLLEQVKPITLENEIMEKLKKKNLLANYPSNMEQIWTTEEENTLLEEITVKTRLDNEQIMKTIARKEPPGLKPTTLEQVKPITLENEIIEMRNDIQELKNTIKNLVEMMKAVYNSV